MERPATKVSYGLPPHFQPQILRLEPCYSQLDSTIIVGRILQFPGQMATLFAVTAPGGHGPAFMMAITLVIGGWNTSYGFYYSRSGGLNIGNSIHVRASVLQSASCGIDWLVYISRNSEYEHSASKLCGLGPGTIDIIAFLLSLLSASAIAAATP
ncbi:hypothetical protein Tco_0014590 [Tanacetum coccineum]